MEAQATDPNLNIVKGIGREKYAPKDGDIGKLFSSQEEHPVPVDATVSGAVPTWLKGGFLRNGPGKFEVGDDKYNHWFDGLALMHRFDFNNGKVQYHSKFLRSDSYTSAMEKNRIVVSEFATFAAPDPCKSMYERFMSYFIPSTTDNANINFFPIGDGLYVSTETNLIRRVEPESLDTLNQSDLKKLVSVNLATAHPHFDNDGTYYNLGTNFRGGCYTVIRIDPSTGRKDPAEGAVINNTIPMTNKGRPSYYHSFSMSGSYVIFHEQPLRFNMWGMMTRRLFGKGVETVMSWDGTLKSILHLCNKKTGEVWDLKFVTDPFVSFHPMNSFEKDGHLVIDLCCADDGSPIENYYLHNLRKTGEDLEDNFKKTPLNYPRRFVIPLDITQDSPQDVNLIKLEGTSATAILKSDGNVHLTFEPLHGDDLLELGGFEFPRINYEHYNAKPYRYCFGTGFGNMAADKLLKLDVVDKTMKVWQEDQYFPSEPVFVPEPNATTEDQGIVLSVVVSPINAKPTFLLLLDGQTFKEVGRATIPHFIPYGTHGQFV